MGEDAGNDPAAWFERRYSTPPGYSALLAALSKSPSTRNTLLRGYFEPSPEEREQGIKVPTTAHRAIARLAIGGYVRVILEYSRSQLAVAA